MELEIQFDPEQAERYEYWRQLEDVIAADAHSAFIATNERLLPDQQLALLAMAASKICSTQVVVGTCNDLPRRHDYPSIPKASLPLHHIRNTLPEYVPPKK